MKHYVILLATDDLSVEAAVRGMGDRFDCNSNSVKTSRDAVSMVMDGSMNQDFAVVDLDMEEGRALMKTAGGALPVIAVSEKANPWLSSMLRHRRIGATLIKPVSPTKLREAFHRLHSISLTEVSRGRQPFVEANLNS